MNILLPKLKKYLYSNGGPIIMVQVTEDVDIMQLKYLQGHN